MSNAIEIEAKALVRSEDYKKLAKAFRGNPRYVQTNHYIDTEDRLLAKEGLAIRIREKGPNYELTLKTPFRKGFSRRTSRSLATNSPSSATSANSRRRTSPVSSCRLDVDVTKLKILTSLKTERIDVEYQGGLLSLDRNTYSGRIDYEIEFEYNSMVGAQKIMTDLFAEHDIPLTFSTASKVQRAMAAIGK